MFEIGSTLREARLRQGLDVLELESRTKIRAKYLRAMEEEQFDVMPSPTYVRGFLRTYAEHLGLDGNLILDEYESRFAELGERAQAAARRRHARSRPVRTTRRKRRSETQLLWLAIGGVMGVALLVWLGVGGESSPEPRLPASTTPEAAAVVTETEREPAPDAAPESPGRMRIVVSGVGEIGSYVIIRGGDADGRIVFDRVLGPGESTTYRVDRGIYLEGVGNPDGLEITIDGDEAELPGIARNYQVSRDGITAAG